MLFGLKMWIYRMFSRVVADVRRCAARYARSLHDTVGARDLVFEKQMKAEVY